MELIEKNESGQTIAKLRATIWRSAYPYLRQKFFQATQRDISTGIKAMVKGSANHHSVFGLSFNIVDIDPSYTMGDLERIRREILMKLAKEGLLDKNKGLPLPLLPQKIAVISAEGAAGYGDFMNQLTSNPEGFKFYPFLFPSVMQGERVSESIRNAILLIESTAEMWDCIVIVRGGGATTDMTGFDDYELARAIATCGLPVIVGIGHERDRNVLDDVANTSLKTPTAVAGFLVDRARLAYERMIGLADRIRIYSTEMIRGEERRLSAIQGSIPHLLMRRLEEAGSRLNSISGKLPLLTARRIGNESVKLDGILKSIPQLVSSKISRQNLKLESLQSMLGNFSTIQVNKAMREIDNFESLVKVLDPNNTLRRGYSITRINGKAQKKADELKEGDVITTILASGEIKSRVIAEK